MLPSVRQLQYLKLLAEHGSFSRAAAAANVTQPTLSAGIAELERTLGAQVVERARSGVILTEAGEHAVARAGAVLSALEDLVQAARSAGRPLASRFRLGIIPTIAPFMLPAALPQLRDRFPELRLFLREDLTHRLIALLKGGELDAALIALPYDLSGLESAAVGDEELLAVVPERHALAKEATVSPQALEREGLILLEGGHCLREHALAACGLHPPSLSREGFAATSLLTLLQMVGSGLGVSLAPAMALHSGLADGAPVVVRPVASEGSRRQIAVVWRRGSARGAESQLLADVFREAMPA